MKTGTKSILFGVHQFIIHPVMILIAWQIIYRQRPNFLELCAIITHDLGYWGSPNMDGVEGELHPLSMAKWWRKYFGKFGEKVAVEILGHSRFYSAKNGLHLSRLFQADKLCVALYPKWLYLLLANLSGEIKEYMVIASKKEGKYLDLLTGSTTQIEWLIEVQAHMALVGLKGKDYPPIKKQLAKDSENVRYDKK